MAGATSNFYGDRGEALSTAAETPRRYRQSAAAGSNPLLSEHEEEELQGTCSHVSIALVGTLMREKATAVPTIGEERLGVLNTQKTNYVECSQNSRDPV